MYLFIGNGYMELLPIFLFIIKNKVGHLHRHPTLTI